MNNKLLILNEEIPWMGKHSGYDKLFNFIYENNSFNCKLLKFNRNDAVNNFFKKSLNPLIKFGRKYSHMYDYPLFKAELQIFYNIKLIQFHLLHITFLERNYGLLQRLNIKNNIKFISTAHQPPSWWENIGRNPEIVNSLDYLITMSRNQAEFFEQFIPGKVEFIPHAVDTNFFKPLDGQRNLSNPRCVFCGTWLRDFETLQNIIEMVLSINKSIRFDIIIPNITKNKSIDTIKNISSHNEVNILSDLSNEQLLKTYQEATMLVLPILDATANNALLESISCGLPVVSNNVGGIPDYVNDDFAHLHETGDVDSFVESIFKIIEDEDCHYMMSKSARNYAENNLSFNKIVNQTLNTYNKIL